MLWYNVSKVFNYNKYRTVVILPLKRIDDKLARIIAALLLFIPGIIGAAGIKLMRDALSAEFYSIFIHEGIKFVVGLIMFVAGLSFIGGFIYHRDKKHQLTRKYIQTNSSMAKKKGTQQQSVEALSRTVRNLKS